MEKTFNIDFDYTVIIPDGEGGYAENPGAERVLKRLIENGHRLILFTCRSNKPFKLENGKFHYNGLDQAINWFSDRNIPLYGVQINPDQWAYTTSNKSHTDIMIDDTCLFIPIKYNLNLSERGFVCWQRIEAELENKGLLI